LKTCVEAPKTVVDIVQDITKLAEQMPELLKDPAGDAKAANLNPLDLAKAVANSAANMAKLGKQVPKCKDLPELVKSAVADLKAVIPKIRDFVKDADTVGKKASDEGNRKPKGIFDKYHPGAKKTEAEIAAEKKAEAEAKKNKKKEKK